MDSSLTIMNANGINQIIHVIDIITDELTNNKYLFYKMDDSNDTYAVKLKENESNYTLEIINDSEELELVRLILKEVIEEGEQHE